ncbi:MAG: MFS transporter [Chloroflexi bacterium]|nr:MAG: MFS transporter [Chloroflexota bacterium]
MSLYLFSAALPLYLFRYRGYSLELVGVLVGLASVVQLVATLISGPLVDRRGARLAMRLGAACYVLAALLFLTSAWLPAIVLARILHGIGIALVLPAVLSVVPALVSRRFRGTALGTVGAFNNVALAIGPPLGLLLLAHAPATLFLTALATAALAISTSLLLNVGGRAPEPGRLFKYRGAWTPLYAITFLSVVYWGVVTAFLPIAVPPSQIPNVGWFFAADAVAVMAARIPTGYLADRFGARWLLVAGVATTGLAISVLLTAPSLVTLVVAGVGTGLGAALLLPPILLELTKRSNDTNRGTAMALYNTSFAAAVGVGSLGGALLVQHFGFNATLVASLIACLAAAPVALVTVRRLEDG